MIWKEQPKTKKGYIAENIIANLLVHEGYQVYMLFNEESHAFDMIINWRDDKLIRFVDVKCKARLESSNSTGIDYKYYQEYIDYTKLYNADFFLMFVDEKEGKVYGQSLRVLDETHSFRLDGMIYWDLENMITFRNLTDAEIVELSQYNQRNPSYDGKEIFTEDDRKELLKKYNELYKKE